MGKRGRGGIPLTLRVPREWDFPSDCEICYDIVERDLYFKFHEDYMIHITSNPHKKVLRHLSPQARAEAEKVIRVEEARVCDHWRRVHAADQERSLANQQHAFVVKECGYVSAIAHMVWEYCYPPL